MRPTKDHHIEGLLSSLLTKTLIPACKNAATSYFAETSVLQIISQGRASTPGVAEALNVFTASTVSTIRLELQVSSL